MEKMTSIGSRMSFKESSENKTYSVENIGIKYGAEWE